VLVLPDVERKTPEGDLVTDPLAPAAEVTVMAIVPDACKTAGKIITMQANNKVTNTFFIKHLSQGKLRFTSYQVPEEADIYPERAEGLSKGMAFVCDNY